MREYISSTEKLDLEKSTFGKQKQQITVINK